MQVIGWLDIQTKKQDRFIGNMSKSTWRNSAYPYSNISKLYDLSCQTAHNKTAENLYWHEHLEHIFCELNSSLFKGNLSLFVKVTLLVPEQLLLLLTLIY